MKTSIVALMNDFTIQIPIIDTGKLEPNDDGSFVLSYYDFDILDTLVYFYNSNSIQNPC